MTKQKYDSRKNKKQPRSNKEIKILAPKEFPLWVVIPLFILLTVVFFWDQLIGNSFFWEDFVEYVLPVQTYAARELAKGNLPFWNPYSFAGMPFLADMQVGFFYPLNRLISIFNPGPDAIPVGITQIVVILHFFISLLNFYVLSRYLKISSIGAIIGAISYTFSLQLVFHVIHPMIVYHLSWLPLIILFFIKAIIEKKFYHSIISGIIFGFVALSGHPQTTLYISLLLLIIFLWFFISSFFSKDIKELINEENFKSKPLLIVKTLILAIIPIIVAFGIFAIQFLPSRELASLSQRNEITYEMANEGSLQFKHIYASVVPKIFGFVDGQTTKNPSYYLTWDGKYQSYFYWETSFYFGLAALILGLIAIFSTYKTNLTKLLTFIALFGFLFALGKGGVIFDIFYNFPMFGSFRNPARIMFFTILSFSLLAGFGYDAIWNKVKEKRILILILIAIAIPLIISILVSSGSVAKFVDTPENYQSQLVEYGNIALIFISVIALFIFLINRSIITATSGGVVLIIIIIVDLFLAGMSFNQSPQNPSEIYKLSPQLKSLLEPKLPKEIFRVNARIYQPVSFMPFQRNQGMVDNIMLIEGYNPLVLQRAKPPINDTKTIFDLYNIKYQLNVDLEKGSWSFAERESYFDRAFLVNEFKVIPDSLLKEKMANEQIDYRNVVVLEELPGIYMPDKKDTISDNIFCEEYQSNYSRYSVKNSQNSILVFSEIWYPGWKVYVNSKQEKLLRANYCFMAVPLEKGNNKVELKFEPDTFFTGLYISLITIFISIIGVLISFRYENNLNLLNFKHKKREEY